LDSYFETKKSFWSQEKIIYYPTTVVQWKKKN